MDAGWIAGLVAFFAAGWLPRIPMPSTGVRKHAAVSDQEVVHGVGAAERSTRGITGALGGDSAVRVRTEVTVTVAPQDESRRLPRQA